eukprot:TRINITY_DN13847_c0_g1_i1.p1 TRINITY_DN13847_c0_g1~~TRINITY_DN13847_c0_g1_i1.p1  ORF type:complete len:756 (+),score=278.71 TRINITY_DN13847_c0_g1_i1:67-2268(+)
MNKQEITIPVNCLSELMEHISAYEKESTGRACVTVLDVFCSTWGACNALKSTFRDITIQDVDDQAVSLKFLQVNASEILSELENKSASDPILTPRSSARSVELQRDILPDTWKEKFEGQIGKAKPMFMFYKDCQYVSSIEGVNTPHIKRTVKTLIKEKKPASDFITNPGLLEAWSDQIGAAEPETSWLKFCRAVNVWCLFPPDAPAFNDEETKILMQALKVEKGSVPMVTAKGIQDWVGEDKFETVFHKALPQYEERIAQERIRKEEEEKNGPPAGEKPEEAKPAETPAEPEPAPEEPKKEEESVTHENVAKKTCSFTEQSDTGGILLGSAQEMNLTKSFTLSVWVNPAEGAAYAEGRTNNDLAILGAGETDKENGYLFVSLRELKPFLSFNGEEHLTTETALPEQEWSHVACSYDSESKTAVLYVGGAEASTMTFGEGVENSVSEDSKALLGAANYKAEAATAFLGRIAGLTVLPEVSKDSVEKAFEDKSFCVEPVEETAEQPKPDSEETKEPVEGDAEKPEEEKKEGEGEGEGEGEAPPADKPEEPQEGKKDETPKEEGLNTTMSEDYDDGTEGKADEEGEEKSEKPAEEGAKEEGAKEEESPPKEEEKKPEEQEGEKTQEPEAEEKKEEEAKPAEEKKAEEKEEAPDKEEKEPEKEEKKEEEPEKPKEEETPPSEAKPEEKKEAEETTKEEEEKPKEAEDTPPAASDGEKQPEKEDSEKQGGEEEKKPEE